MIRDSSIRSSLLLNRVCVPLCLSLSLISACTSQAQSIASPALASQAHIMVHVTSEYGDPAGFLERKDFHVMDRNTPVPFELNRPPVDAIQTPNAVPTRLLIVLSSPESRHDLDRLADKLKPLWKNAWQISVLKAQGTQTPYVTTDADFRGALSRGVGHLETISTASVDLARFTGRRAILFITRPNTSVDMETVRAARRASAMLYHVGGGQQKSRIPVYSPDPDYNFIEFNAPGTDIFASVNIVGAPHFYVNKIYGGVIEERNLADAREDLLRDGLGFYDLKMVLPEQTTSLDLALDIFDNRKGHYEVHAQTYAEGRTPPQLKLIASTPSVQRSRRH